MAIFDGLKHGQPFYFGVGPAPLAQVSSPGILSQSQNLSRSLKSKRRSEGKEPKPPEGLERQRIDYGIEEQDINRNIELVRNKAIQNFSKYGSANEFLRSDDGQNFVEQINMLSGRKKALEAVTGSMKDMNDQFKLVTGEMIKDGTYDDYFLNDKGKRVWDPVRGKFFTNQEWYEDQYRGRGLFSGQYGAVPRQSLVPDLQGFNDAVGAFMPIGTNPLIHGRNVPRGTFQEHINTLVDKLSSSGSFTKEKVSGMGISSMKPQNVSGLSSEDAFQILQNSSRQTFTNKDTYVALMNKAFSGGLFSGSEMDDALLEYYEFIDRQTSNGKARFTDKNQEVLEYKDASGKIQQYNFQNWMADRISGNLEPHVKQWKEIEQKGFVIGGTGQFGKGAADRTKGDRLNYAFTGEKDNPAVPYRSTAKNNGDIIFSQQGNPRIEGDVKLKQGLELARGKINEQVDKMMAQKHPSIQKGSVEYDQQFNKIRSDITGRLYETNDTYRKLVDASTEKMRRYSQEEGQLPAWAETTANILSAGLGTVWNWYVGELVDSSQYKVYADYDIMQRNFSAPEIGIVTETKGDLFELPSMPGKNGKRIEAIDVTERNYDFYLTGMNRQRPSNKSSVTGYITPQFSMHGYREATGVDPEGNTSYGDEKIMAVGGSILTDNIDDYKVNLREKAGGQLTEQNVDDYEKLLGVLSFEVPENRNDYEKLLESFGIYKGSTLFGKLWVKEEGDDLYIIPDASINFDAFRNQIGNFPIYREDEFHYGLDFDRYQSAADAAAANIIQ